MHENYTHKHIHTYQFRLIFFIINLRSASVKTIFGFQAKQEAEKSSSFPSKLFRITNFLSAFFYISAAVVVVVAVVRSSHTNENIYCS